MVTFKRRNNCGIAWLIGDITKGDFDVVNFWRRRKTVSPNHIVLYIKVNFNNGDI